MARGDLVSPGYYNNPEATAEARAFGWHHTGDIGVFDENGYLYVVDRKKDMVISGGFNIYPSEIEQVIWGHPAVQDCAVVGVPDADWGERLTAVIELKPGTSATADEIIEMCRKRFGSLKTPKQVEFWPTLPRSPVGKVLKKDVRAQLVGRIAGGLRRTDMDPKALSGRYAIAGVGEAGHGQGPAGRHGPVAAMRGGARRRSWTRA